LRSKYKLVITDLDGTLLDYKQRIHPANVKALQELKDAGIPVVPATGRGKRSAEGVINGLPLSEYLICFQGAAVFKGDRAIWHQPVGDVLPYIKLLREHKNVNSAVFATHAEGVEDLTMFAPYYAEAADYLVKQGGTIINGDRVLEAATKNLTKVVYFGKLQDLLDIQLIWLELDPTKNVVLSSDFTLDLTHQNATKGFAAKHLVESCGLKMEEVLAIGDNYNDMDLLEEAGFSVAMADAPPEVRQVADAVTGRAAEGGFAEAIYKYVLG
jgi:Cof subfamily protein (haloacid dehalogenase superfamily)